MKQEDKSNATKTIIKNDNARISSLSYLPCDQKSTKEIPECVEWGSNYRCNTLVWSNCYRHHAKKGEVQQCEIHKEDVPQELGHRPLK